MLKIKTFTQLSEAERVKIEVLLSRGLSYRKIAEVLGRSASTISREVGRNGPRKYVAPKAHSKAIVRHRQKVKRRVFDKGMKQYIADCLTELRWSPEIIAAKGKELRSDFVCAEWIYQWIWAMKFSMVKGHRRYNLLYRFLKNSRRRKRRGRVRCARGNILNRVWIDKRPRSADKRRRHGDLEGDIAVGKNRLPALLVVLDRKSRKIWIRKIKTRETNHVVRKLKKVCMEAGARTLTLDNDLSFALHYKLNPCGVKTFFTHPYSSQEKGSVENRIGILRQFYPKKTDFSQVSSTSIRKVEKLINERPMRMFKYLSPNQIHIS